MKIWHVGASSSPYRVDGVSRTVWSLSRQQAKLGHRVSLLIDTPPEPAAVQLAQEAGLKLIAVKASALTYRSEVRRILQQEAPQIVHMHSVFVVRQAALGMVLRDLRIPYIITPHAGLSPQVLKRGVIKKSLYSALRERPRFMGASAIGLVTPNEERNVRAYLPGFRKPVRWMPNPIDIDQFDPNQWQGGGPPNRVVYMGRFDVLAKGIDILVEIARLLPEAQFDLFGTEDRRTRPWLHRLKADLPPNVSFRAPIFGPQKTARLMETTIYMQPSRWEGFPVSVAECLYLGVPCAIAETLDMAHLFHQHDLGLVVPPDPGGAAQALREAMADPKRLLEWSRRGRQFANDHFHPLASARNHIELYEEVIAAAAPSPMPAPHAVAGQAPGVMPMHVRSSLKRNVSTLLHRSRELLGSNGHPRTIVLCYHSINEARSDLSVDPSVFRRQIQVLKDSGFRFTDFRGLVKHLIRRGSPCENVACITLDDGYEDNLTRAAPILLDMKVPATIFVTSGLMAKDAAIIDRFRRLAEYPAAYLSDRQVRELAGLGFEIGSHTHSHPNLARLSPEQTWQELRQSRELLEEAVGGPVATFAYPFGKRAIHYTSETVSMVRESGMQGAAAVSFRAVNSRSSVRIYELPRFFVTRSDTAESFAQKVRGDYDWLGALQHHTPRWFKGMVSPEDRYV